MGTHAILSPSSAKRWRACPGSVARTKDMPYTTSKYADEGTAAHFLAATCLTNKTNPADYKDLRICLWRHDESGSSGEEFEENLDHAFVDVTASFDVDDEMIDQVGKYVDYVRGVSEHAELYVEQRLPIDHITTEKGAEGTSDSVLIDVANSELIIVDLKYGAGEAVNVVDNDQLIMYWLAAYRKFGPIYEIDKARIVIHQPRKDYVGEYTYTLAEMLQFEADILADAKVALSDNPPIVPGKAQCRWCKASGTCAEQDAFLASELEVDFEDLTADTPKQFATDVVEKINRKMSAIEILEDMCKAVRSRCEVLAFEGAPGLEYKVVQGRKSARSWTSEADALAQLKSFRMKNEDIYDMKLKSPTKLEKDLKAQPKRWIKLEPLIEQKEGKPTVAHISDPRPAISVAPEFGDVREEQFKDLI